MGPEPGRVKKNLRIVSWALYDTANQFFVLNIVSLYFVRWVTLEKGAPEIFYSLAFGVSTFFVAFFSPVLGTMADITKRHKPALIFLTLLSVAFTFLMGLTQNLPLALAFFAVANFGCQQAIIFYNALMLNVAPGSRVGLVSGMGKMFGYFGAFLALLFTKPVLAGYGYQAVFFLTAGLFLFFSLPCLIFVKDSAETRDAPPKVSLDMKLFYSVFRRLKETIFGKNENLALQEFLKAAFFGLAVINIIMLFMSVYATRVFGLNEGEIVSFIGFGVFFAVIGSIGAGILSDRFGYKRVLVYVFVLWILCLFGGGILIAPWHWLVGAISGLALGATWVVSRALVIRIVPKEKTAEAFGFFNLVGYVSGIIGPLIWGLILLVVRPLGVFGYRLALLSLIPLLIIGLLYLRRIPNLREESFD